ncbi:unnamed protein product [Rhizophagus irregularis]|nr:unnamed protein product [Rhizophagus irregularis]
MIGEYSCPYLCNTGKACGNACIHLEGCRFHWKAKKRVQCPDCGKPIASACGRCPDYVRGYYVIQFYDRDTLAILNITLCKECLLPIKMDERNIVIVAGQNKWKIILANSIPKS